MEILTRLSIYALSVDMADIRLVIENFMRIPYREHGKKNEIEIGTYKIVKVGETSYTLFNNQELVNTFVDIDEIINNLEL